MQLAISLVIQAFHIFPCLLATGELPARVEDSADVLLNTTAVVTGYNQGLKVLLSDEFKRSNCLPHSWVKYHVKTSLKQSYKTFTNYYYY